MTEKQTLEIFIDHAQEGTYLTLPFTMPRDIESITLHYDYDRFTHSEGAAPGGKFTSSQQINIIDLALIAPNGSQAGASGSDKQTISLGETDSTPGYRVMPLTAGEWQILVGAYQVSADGVKVSYEIEFMPKTRCLLKGDLHTHTLASDGVLTHEELAHHARRHGLDFLAVTDHNQMVSADFLPEVPGLTLIPGVEWTHYKGHANFLGVDRPFDGSFYSETLEESQKLFQTARERGALITLNHPFEESCPFEYDMGALPFDVLEVWNGPMRESNLRSVALWQSMLAAGQKMPACGGSDYHRDRLFQILGGPTTCVYAKSSSRWDILEAVRQGHSYMIFSPEGPSLVMHSGDAIMGDSLPWEPGVEISLEIDYLQKEDVIRVITADDIVDHFKAPASGSYQGTLPVEAPGFVRIEVCRSFLPGVPALPALLSNPIYFDESAD